MRLGSQRRQFSTVRAKSLHKPQLRGDLSISAQETNEQLSYVIKVPGKSSYFRYGALEHEILELCNGERTPAEIAEEMTGRHPAVPLSESHVIDFLDTVESILWERTRIERNLAVLERIRAERNQQIDPSSLLNIRFKPWNPDRFLEAVNRYAGWIFTSGFALASIGFVLLTIYLFCANWARIVEDTEALYNFEGQSYFDIVWFWLLLLALEFVHEFGHGMVCKHFGGEVPEMGFSLVYFTPSLYMDTSDMLLFNWRQRYLVIFAGVWIEIIVCGMAMLIWSASYPGTFLNDLAYKTVLLTGIDAVAWNLNPLIKADGYYALADYLGIDNLAERSQEYLWAWTRLYLLRMDVELPPASRRDRRIFLGLGIGALVNTAVLVGASLLLLNKIFDALQLGSLGNLLTLFVICLLARKYLAVCWKAGTNWINQWKENRMEWRPSQLQKVAAIGIVALVFVPPLPTHVAGDFVLEPGTKTFVRAKVEGKVSEVYVREGSVVTAGQVIALLENPEVESNAGILSRELALAGGDVRSSEYQYDASRAAEANRTRLRLQSAFTVARERQSALRISAPMDGVVATAMLEQKEGEFLAAGEDFCEIVDREKLRARILVHDWDVPDIQPGADVQLKVEAFPFRTYSGKVERVLPAMAKDSASLSELDEPKHAEQLTNYMTLLVTVSNADGLLRENMTGTAKISVTRRSLAWLAARDAWRWLRRQIY